MITGVVIYCKKDYMNKSGTVLATIGESCIIKHVQVIIGQTKPYYFESLSERRKRLIKELNHV